MSNDELRAEIGLAVGWNRRKDTREYEPVWYWQNPDGYYEFLPDYPNDPAACAREVLPEIERRGWSWYGCSLSPEINHGNTVEITVNDCKNKGKHLGEAMSKSFVEAHKAEKGQQP